MPTGPWTQGQQGLRRSRSVKRPCRTAATAAAAAGAASQAGAEAAQGGLGRRQRCAYSADKRAKQPKYHCSSLARDTCLLFRHGHHCKVIYIAESSAISMLCARRHMGYGQLLFEAEASPS